MKLYGSPEALGCICSANCLALSSEVNHKSTFSNETSLAGLFILGMTTLRTKLPKALPSYSLAVIRTSSMYAKYAFVAKAPTTAP